MHPYRLLNPLLFLWYWKKRKKENAAEYYVRYFSHALKCRNWNVTHADNTDTKRGKMLHQHFPSNDCRQAVLEQFTYTKETQIQFSSMSCINVMLHFWLHQASTYVKHQTQEQSWPSQQHFRVVKTSHFWHCRRNTSSSNMQVAQKECT